MNIKEILQQAFITALQDACTNGKLTPPEQIQMPDFFLEVPPRKELGDFATNFAMQSSRVFRTNPRVIAQALIEHFQCEYVSKLEVAGAGFINIFLVANWPYQMLAHLLQKGEQFGNLPLKTTPKIQIEFVSANPTGKLHVGHGRGAAFGSSLANLLSAAGYPVQKEFYINDAGNQMDNLALSVEARYLELLGQPIVFPEDGYHGQDIIDTAQAIRKLHGDKYLNYTSEQRLSEFKEFALQEKLQILKDDLAAFDVTFDNWFSERTLYKDNKVQEACDTLAEKGFLYEDNGAKWLRSTAFGDDKDRVVIRDNGVPTYLAADIAYHQNKLQRGFDQLINIWGADHHGYIARVKAAIAALGYSPEALEVLILQMVSLYRDGELVKMSKRTGKSITLSELIEEVGKDATRYFFTMRSIDSQLDFDMTLAIEKSSDNPVYYVQYAHARICSIFKQLQELNIATDITTDFQKLSLLTTECELDIIRKIGRYEEEIAVAAAERTPHKIAHYIFELAGLFHTFYNQCRIVGVDNDLQQARISLVSIVKHNLVHALKILGVSAPDKM